MAAPKGNKFGLGNRGHATPRPLRQMLISALNELEPETVAADGNPSKKKVERMALMVRKLVQMAIGGDLDAIAMIFDRVEGKPIQGVAIAHGTGDSSNSVVPHRFSREELSKLSEAEVTQLYREQIAAGQEQLLITGSAT